MVKTQAGNPCFLCGKQRITIGVKKEKIGNSVVTTTQTACPDPECQKKLDIQLGKEKAVRDKAAENKQFFLRRGKRS